MNNAAVCLKHSKVKHNQNANLRIPVAEFIFNDHSGTGSFLFKDIRLELFQNGKWCFYMAAVGLNATTTLKNGRNSGPEVYLQFRDKQGELLSESSLGQVNYNCHEESGNAYICKGSVENSGAVETVEIRYDAFMDFACRQN